MRPLSGARVTIAPGADDGNADVARFAEAVRELGLDRARALATFSYDTFEAEFQAPERIG